MIRSLFAVLIFTTLVGCTNNLAVNENSVQLDLPKFAHALAKNMANRQLKISKTFVLNEISETKIYSQSDTAFWVKELVLLENIDLNSPQLNGTFEIEKGLEDQFSNLIIDKYSFAPENEIGIKKLLIYYLDVPGDIRHINAELSNSNLISKSSSELSIWMNRYSEALLIDSLEVISTNKTLMQPARNYRNITKTQR
jgi:hypothetical protein